MTKEEELQQQQKDARVDEFRAWYDSFIQQREAADRQQIIGRDYDTRPEGQGDLIEQRRETEQRIDKEFEEDERGLVVQDLQERKDFDDRMKEVRVAMRRQDATEARQEAERFRNSTDEIKQGITAGRDALNVQREQTRDGEAARLKEKFTDFQDQRHDDRLTTLNKRNDENNERVQNAFEQAHARQEPTQRQAANRTSDDLQRDLQPAQEQNNIKMKKGETEEQARERTDRMEQRRQEREQQERQQQQTRKDDWVGSRAAKPPVIKNSFDFYLCCGLAYVSAHEAGGNFAKMVTYGVNRKAIQRPTRTGYHRAVFRSPRRH